MEVRRRVFPDAYFYSEAPDEGHEGPRVVNRPVERDRVAARQELIEDKRHVIERLTLSETAIDLLLEVERSLVRTRRRELQASRASGVIDFREIKHTVVVHSLTIRPFGDNGELPYPQVEPPHGVATRFPSALAKGS